MEGDLKRLVNGRQPQVFLENVRKLQIISELEMQDNVNFF